MIWIWQPSEPVGFNTSEDFEYPRVCQDSDVLNEDGNTLIQMRLAQRLVTSHVICLVTSSLIARALAEYEHLELHH